MLNIHPSFVGPKGKPDYVKLPYQEFLKIQEALEDAMDLGVIMASRKAEKGKKRYTLQQLKERHGL